MDKQLTPQDLADYITTHHLDAEVILMPTSTHTVEEAAQALNVVPDQIMKSILFNADGTPVLVLAPGTYRIDYKGLAKHFGINRKKMRMSHDEETIELCGYPNGGVPPFGHKTSLITLADPDIFQFDIVYAGGGDPTTVVRCNTATIKELPNLTLFSVQKPPVDQSQEN
jgi:prolyl-tRNA editing enzyme YbaK/EbsC (Cys-tRNA(Pro) deacylase)